MTNLNQNLNTAYVQLRNCLTNIFYLYVLIYESNPNLFPPAHVCFQVDETVAKIILKSTKLAKTN